MDPLTACSLAGNVLTFLDSAFKIVSGARDIYKSPDGHTTEVLEIDNAIKRLSTLTHALQTDQAPGEPSSTETRTTVHRLNLKQLTQALKDSSVKKIELSLRKNNANQINPHKQNIEQVVKDCISIGNELATTLNRLKATPNRRWESFQKALLTIWKKDKIESLQLRLTNLRGELTLHFVALIRGDLAQSTALSQQIATSGHQKTQDKIDLMREDLIAAINRTHPGQDDINSVSQRLIDLSLREEEEQLPEAFLDDLYLPQLLERRDLITDAHAKTLSWLVRRSPDQSQFMSWVCKGEGIYWVTGKPGSGKSTLMKYLETSGEVSAGLNEWSERKRLVIAAFYFWISGSSIQKSLLGLLRSLFYTILRDNIELIPKLFSWRWRQYQAIGRCTEPWTQKEFMDAVSAINSDLNKDCKFCFFIDGLDEFEGDHRWLMGILEKLCQSPRVKMCISSREWSIFQDTYRGKPWLRMQDLNEDDIRTYLLSELEAYPRWLNMRTRSPVPAQKITDTVLGKANGVFLWVYMVARSLKNGLQDGDTLENLQAHVNDLPSDLEEYFMQILRNVNQRPDYLRQMHKYLLVAIESSEPLLLWTYSYLDDFDEKDDKVDADGIVSPLTITDIADNCENTRRRIKDRCKELLDIYVSSGYSTELSIAEVNGLLVGRKEKVFNTDWLSRVKIAPLHRTLRDFLRTPSARAALGLDDNYGGRIHKLLLRAYLKQLQEFPRHHNAAKANSKVYCGLFDGILIGLHNLVRKYGVSTEPSSYFLEQLEKINRLSPRGPSQTFRTQDFLEYMVDLRYVDWLATRLSRNDPLQNKAILARLLVFAVSEEQILRFSQIRSKGPDPRIVELLLALGADPSTEVLLETPMNGIPRQAVLRSKSIHRQIQFRNSTRFAPRN